LLVFSVEVVLVASRENSWMGVIDKPQFRVFDFSMSASFAFLVLRVSAMEVRTMLRGPSRIERLTVGGGSSLLSHGYHNLHSHLCALA